MSTKKATSKKPAVSKPVNVTAKVMVKPIAVKAPVKPAAKPVAAKTVVKAVAKPAVKKPVVNKAKAPVVNKVTEAPKAVSKAKETKAVLVAPEIKKKPPVAAKKPAKKATGKKIPSANFNPKVERESMLRKKAPHAPKGANLHVQTLGVKELFQAMHTSAPTNLPVTTGFIKSLPVPAMRKPEEKAAPAVIGKAETARPATISVQELFSKLAHNAAAVAGSFVPPYPGR